MNDGFLIELKGLGITHFIQKPIHMEQLIGSIEICCVAAVTANGPKVP
jgi:hypothetical protein